MKNNVAIHFKNKRMPNFSELLKNLVFGLGVTLSSLAIAQSDIQIVSTERLESTPELSSKLESIFYDFELITMDVDGLNEAIRSKVFDVNIMLQGEPWRLELSEFEMRTDDFEKTVNGVVVQEGKGRCTTFRGIDKDHFDRQILALISPDYVSISALSEKEDFFIEQANVLLKDFSVPKNLFVVYKRSSLAPSTATCSQGTVEPPASYLDKIRQEESEAKIGTNKCILVAKVETNIDQWAFFDNFGSSTSIGDNYTLNILNLVSSLYWDYNRIQLVVTAQNSYTNAIAPWAISNEMDAYAIRNQFRDWMNANRSYDDHNRTVSVLFTGRNITSTDNGNVSNSIIGLAYFPWDNPLCTTFNINEIRSTNAQQQILVAHELGHNFGATHCMGNGCGPTGPGTEEGCNTQQGTIMCGVCCNNTAQFTFDASTAIRGSALNRLDVDGCFGTYNRVLSTANDPSCYFGNCAGFTSVDFIYHTVQTSGTMNISNTHSGLSWTGGDKVILKPGFKVTPASADDNFNINIDECDGFLGSGGEPNALIASSAFSDGNDLNDHHFSGENIKVYPNPTSGQSFVEIHISRETIATIRVMDALGRQVMVNVLGLVEGKNTLTLETEALNQGLYIVNISDQNGLSQTLKLQKID